MAKRHAQPQVELHYRGWLEQSLRDLLAKVDVVMGVEPVGGAVGLCTNEQTFTLQTPDGAIVLLSVSCEKSTHADGTLHNATLKPGVSISW